LQESKDMIQKLNISVQPNPNGDRPQVDPTSYIDPTARVIGNVQIGAQVFVGPNAVIRADESDDKNQVHSMLAGEHHWLMAVLSMGRVPWDGNALSDLERWYTKPQ
jgi:hypothetical protein